MCPVVSTVVILQQPQGSTSIRCSSRPPLPACALPCRS
ncbi:hypothetical protein DD556_17610 [Phaeobacter sp. JL2872]|nr:hypothetical protein DD556_17610 [Phaeobacter sp. JL2872]